MNKHYVLLKPIAEKIADELEKTFPTIKDAEYDTGGQITTFVERMVFGMYIELIRGGFIK